MVRLIARTVVTRLVAVVRIEWKFSGTAMATWTVLMVKTKLGVLVGDNREKTFTTWHFLN